MAWKFYCLSDSVRHRFESSWGLPFGFIFRLCFLESVLDLIFAQKPFLNFSIIGHLEKQRHFKLKNSWLCDIGVFFSLSPLAFFYKLQKWSSTLTLLLENLLNLSSSSLGTFSFFFFNFNFFGSSIIFLFFPFLFILIGG